MPEDAKRADTWVRPGEECSLGKGKGFDFLIQTKKY